MRRALPAFRATFSDSFFEKSIANRKKANAMLSQTKFFVLLFTLKPNAGAAVWPAAWRTNNCYPMENACVIGLDYGTDSVRALLVDAVTGREIDSEVALYPRWNRGLYSDPRVARFRQHPKDYLEALRAAVGAVARRHPAEAAAVRALSVDTTASTPCLTDGRGVPLALQEKYAENPDAMFVLWKDHTGQAESEEINALCARSRINYARHSGNCYSAECFWSKVLHLLRGDAELRRDARSVVELCDWIPAVLTGCPDAASVRMSHCVCGSKLMWAEEWGGYPPEEFFSELDPVLLPVLRNLPAVNYGCDVAAGRLTEEWAARLGLPAGIPVGVGCIDSHSGAVGAGVRCGTVVLNLGTSACYMAVMPPEEIGDRVVEGIFGQVDGSILPRMIGFESGLSAFGDVYAWFKRLLCWPLREILAHTELVDAPTRERLIAETESGIMEALTRGAAALTPRIDAPLATDWLNGRRSPFPDSALTATLTGLDLSTSAPEIYYAFAEATAFATKYILDHMRDSGVRIERLVGVGGIAQKSPFVMQLLADTMGMRIDVSDCKQAGAMGAVVHAAAVAGLYPSVTEAQEALCAPSSRSYEPDASRAELLSKRYARYRAVGAFTEQLKNNK